MERLRLGNKRLQRGGSACRTAAAQEKTAKAKAKEGVEA